LGKLNIEPTGAQFPEITIPASCNGFLSRSHESSRTEFHSGPSVGRGEVVGMAADGNRTTYCRQQAAECALAATTAILGEARQAYLNIEQAWLQLAPDINSDSVSKKVARRSTASECEEHL
jgi:hypothetical protein